VCFCFTLDSLTAIDHQNLTFFTSHIFFNLMYAQESIRERPQSRIPTEQLSTPSLSMMAIANERTPRIIEEACSEIDEDHESPMQGQTGVVDNRLAQRVRPGAFAVSGVETAGRGRDDEYTITGTSVLPVTARIVNDSEEDVDLLQEQLRQQDEQLRQQEEELERIRAERESVAVAHVIENNSNNKLLKIAQMKRDIALTRKRFVYVAKLSLSKLFGPRMKWIITAIVILLVVGIVLGIVLQCCLPEPTVANLLSDGTIPPEIGLLTSLSELHQV